MAVHISSFTAWVTIEGAPCPIYALRYTEGKDASCWIPSEEGKTFSVNWRNECRDKPIYAQLSIDGVVCSTHFMLDAQNFPFDANAIGISYATTSDFTRRDFVFDAIQITDDDQYLFTVDDPPRFGTIRLELWEAHIERVVQSPFQHRYGSAVLESQVIHETSKKAGAHQVKFGGEYVVPQATVNMVSGSPKGHEALATFTFNYRSAQILMAGGIIPRPPQPLQHPVKSEQIADRIENLQAELDRLRNLTGGTSRPILKPFPGLRQSKVPTEVIDLTHL
ncbi:hypothetical protein C8J57DRAFT_1287797 [Mycena rebaudengoi]|nr:hypothetical protein C8J57DRAFT_1287797 [Mycena rebaudengoi]